MTVKICTIKAEDNFRNWVLADDDKLGDQVMASMTLGGRKFSAMGDSQDEAIKGLREVVNDHFNAEKVMAQGIIDKAIGIRFFE